MYRNLRASPLMYPSYDCSWHASSSSPSTFSFQPFNAYIQCWRVPSKVWLGLPDGHLGNLDSGNAKDTEEDDDDAVDGDAIVHTPKYRQYAAALTEMNEVVLTGFSALSGQDQKEFVLHCMERGNWARKMAPRKKKAKKKADADADGAEEDAKPAASGVTVPTESLEGFINDFDMVDGAKKPATCGRADGASMLMALAKSVGDGEDGAAAIALALKKEKFVAPVPGVGKGVAGALDGLRFVLT